MKDTGTQPLWKIVEDPTISVKDKLSHLLLKATGVLRQDIGMISQVNGQTYRIVFVTDEAAIHAEDTFNLGDTYCGLAMRQGQVLSIDTMRVPSQYRHPCHEVLRVESYIGVPVYASPGLFGTLNFISSRQRTSPFDEMDREFADKVGAMIGEVLDQWLAQSK